MNRIIVATQAVALLLAAQVAPVEGQTILVDATVSLPPVEARVVVGPDHGGVVVHEARRRSPVGNARMREALRRAERDFLRDLRKAKNKYRQRLAQAQRKFRRDRRRFGRSVAQRKHRRAVRQAEHRYQQEVRRAEHRYEARQRQIRRRFRHRSYRFR
jgi:hypothetical protein